MATICRYTPAGKDAEVTEFAIQATVPQLRRTLSRYGFDAEAKPAKDEEARRCGFGSTERGTWTLRAETPLDEGARVEATMRAIHDEMIRGAGSDEERRAITWADVFVEMADRATANSPVRAHHDRHRVWLHLNVNDTGQFTGHLHMGSPLADWARRYHCCDTDITPILEHLGLPVGFGRRIRTVPDRLRVIIEDRDGGCRVPGCARNQHLHVHHIVHWEDGGVTDTYNLICLCRYHHRLHHRGLLGITGNADTPNAIIFTDQHGRTIAPAGTPAPPGNLHHHKPPPKPGTPGSPTSTASANASKPNGSTSDPPTSTDPPRAQPQDQR